MLDTINYIVKSIVDETKVEKNKQLTTTKTIFHKTLLTVCVVRDVRYLNWQWVPIVVAHIKRGFRIGTATPKCERHTFRTKEEEVLSTLIDILVEKSAVTYGGIRLIRIRA